MNYSKSLSELLFEDHEDNELVVERKKKKGDRRRAKKRAQKKGARKANRKKQNKAQKVLSKENKPVIQIKNISRAAFITLPEAELQAFVQMLFRPTPGLVQRLVQYQRNAAKLSNAKGSDDKDDAGFLEIRNAIAKNINTKFYNSLKKSNNELSLGLANAIQRAPTTAGAFGSVKFDFLNTGKEDKPTSQTKDIQMFDRLGHAFFTMVDPQTNKKIKLKDANGVEQVVIFILPIKEYLNKFQSKIHSSLFSSQEVKNESVDFDLGEDLIHESSLSLLLFEQNSATGESEVEGVQDSSASGKEQEPELDLGDESEFEEDDIEPENVLSDNDISEFENLQRLIAISQMALVLDNERETKLISDDSKEIIETLTKAADSDIDKNEKTVYNKEYKDFLTKKFINDIENLYKTLLTRDDIKKYLDDNEQYLVIKKFEAAQEKVDENKPEPEAEAEPENIDYEEQFKQGKSVNIKELKVSLKRNKKGENPLKSFLDSLDNNKFVKITNGDKTLYYSSIRGLVSEDRVIDSPNDLTKTFEDDNPVYDAATIELKDKSQNQDDAKELMNWSVEVKTSNNKYYKLYTNTNNKLFRNKSHDYFLSVFASDQRIAIYSDTVNDVHGENLTSRIESANEIINNDVFIGSGTNSDVANALEKILSDDNLNAREALDIIDDMERSKSEAGPDAEDAAGSTEGEEQGQSSTGLISNVGLLFLDDYVNKNSLNFNENELKSKNKGRN